MRMPFGKFKGLELADLPDEYLDWLMGLVDLRDPLRMGVEQEAQRREQRLSAEARSPSRHDCHCGLPAAHQALQ